MSTETRVSKEEAIVNRKIEDRGTSNRFASQPRKTVRKESNGKEIKYSELVKKIAKDDAKPRYMNIAGRDKKLIETISKLTRIFAAIYNDNPQIKAGSPSDLGIKLEELIRKKMNASDDFTKVLEPGTITSEFPDIQATVVRGLARDVDVCVECKATYDRKKSDSTAFNVESLSERVIRPNAFHFLVSYKYTAPTAKKRDQKEITYELLNWVMRSLYTRDKHQLKCRERPKVTVSANSSKLYKTPDECRYILADKNGKDFEGESLGLSRKYIRKLWSGEQVNNGSTPRW